MGKKTCTSEFFRRQEFFKHLCLLSVSPYCVSANGNSGCEKLRDNLSNPSGASRIWEIDCDWPNHKPSITRITDWNKIFIIIQSNKPLWITSALDKSESTSQNWEASPRFDKLSCETELPDVLLGCTQAVCLSACLFVCLWTGLFVRLSVCLFVCLFVCLWTCLSVCL